MDHGVSIIERETFEAALSLGRKALEQLGFSEDRAREVAMKFREHNLRTLHGLYPYYQDQQQLISMAAQAREELEAMFAHDVEALTESTDGNGNQNDSSGRR